MTRIFEDAPGVRAAVPLLVGLVGASSSGKTKSALRLALGMQRISGGDIWGVDSEADRMCHYAPVKGGTADPPKTFGFRHLHFASPFNPGSYLDAVEHCAKRGAKTIIIDSASHMHEGPGGTLEAHEVECERLIKAWGITGPKARETVQMSAWQRPKAELRRFINTILQMQINFIICYRAKPKMEIAKGKAPEKLGYMAIAGDEMTFEHTVGILLYPNSGGVPTWTSALEGERDTIKLPDYFRGIFAVPRPLDEEHGALMARWAKGEDISGDAPAPAPAPTRAPAAPASPTPASQPAASPAREKINAAIYEQAEALEWTAARSTLWLRDVFGVAALKDLTDAQAGDARELLIDMAIGEVAYNERLSGLRAKGRVK